MAASLSKRVIEFLFLAVIAIGGCSMGEQPRIRIGSYATATLGTNFIDANNLGIHSSSVSFAENNGIVYTCRGGHIDIAHVRIAADNVRYLYYIIQRNLMEADDSFTFKSGEMPSCYYVTIKYPQVWRSLRQSEKRIISEEVALELSQYFSYTMTTWHEVLTWFGYKSTGFFPEFPSAFSWEDNYSNLLGVRLGAEALLDKGHNFNEAMTIVLKKELENLGVKSASVAKAASEKTKGQWWNGTPFLVYVEMKQRNMDIGLIDGCITPTIVPGVCEGAIPQSYPAPALTKFHFWGFDMKFEVEPKEFEKDLIFKIVKPDEGEQRLNLPSHLPMIIDYIKKQAAEMGYKTMPAK